jgi:hypothetical protein
VLIGSPDHVGSLFDFRHWLIRMGRVGDKALALTIDKQIQLFEHSLPN